MNNDMMNEINELKRKNKSLAKKLQHGGNESSLIRELE